MAELNPRQLRFVQLYVRLGNVGEAARQAGYNPRTADQQGSRLLKNVKVHEMVEAALQDVQTLFAAEVIPSLRTLIAVRDDVEAPPQVRVTAARDLLDRAGHKPPEKVALSGEVKTQHEDHYHVTQEIVSAHPELIDRIFGSGVGSRSGPGES